MPDKRVTTEVPDRKEQIINTALELFFQNGVAGTSMRQLAKAVGMKAASLYNHIRSKDEIIDLLVEKGVKSLDYLVDYHASLGDLDSNTAIRKCIEYWLKQGEKNQEIVLFFYLESQFLNPTRRELFNESTRRLIEFFERLLRKGINSGEFKIIDPALVAFNIWGLQFQ